MRGLSDPVALDEARLLVCKAGLAGLATLIASLAWAWFIGRNMDVYILITLSFCWTTTMAGLTMMIDVRRAVVVLGRDARGWVVHLATAVGVVGAALAVIGVVTAWAACGSILAHG